MNITMKWSAWRWAQENSHFLTDRSSRDVVLVTDAERIFRVGRRQKWNTERSAECHCIMHSPLLPSLWVTKYFPRSAKLIIRRNVLPVCCPGNTTCGQWAAKSPLDATGFQCHPMYWYRQTVSVIATGAISGETTVHAQGASDTWTVRDYINRLMTSIKTQDWAVRYLTTLSVAKVTLRRW
jgi:hypothetical protein